AAPAEPHPPPSGPAHPGYGACAPPLEAGCSAPVAAYAELAEGETGDEIYLRGAVISPDGTRDLRLSRTGTPADAAEIGKALAAELLDLGADSILGHEGHTGPGTQQFGSTE
ncbi:hydroxymethylbilane synthase, partial [Micromonospora sp. NPDC049089]